MCSVFKTYLFNIDTFGHLGFPSKSTIEQIFLIWKTLGGGFSMWNNIVNTFYRTNIFNLAIIWADGFPM